jgi:hypothetical protein
MTETIRDASGATLPENAPGALPWQGPLVREIPEEERDDRRCWVALRTGPSTTGEHCEGLVAYEVYGIGPCEVHGAESKAGALEELYHHASEDLQRPFNPEVAPIGNRAAAWALREAEGELSKRCRQAESETVAALLRAWPFKEEFTDPETLGYTWSRAESDQGGPPEEWFRGPRLLIHELMRLALEDGAHYLVEVLERERQSTAAQLAYALADAERKGHGYRTR